LTYLKKFIVFPQTTIICKSSDMNPKDFEAETSWKAWDQNLRFRSLRYQGSILSPNSVEVLSAFPRKIQSLKNLMIKDGLSKNLLSNLLLNKKDFYSRNKKCKILWQLIWQIPEKRLSCRFKKKQWKKVSSMIIEVKAEVTNLYKKWHTIWNFASKSNWDKYWNRLVR